MKSEVSKDNKSRMNDIARYSAIPFQMVAIVGLFAFGGVQLDKWLQTNFPYFTLILVLVGFGIALYQAIRGLLK